MSDVNLSGPLWLSLLLEKVQEHKEADSIVFMKNGQPIGSIYNVIEMCPVEWLVNFLGDIYTEEFDKKK